MKFVAIVSALNKHRGARRESPSPFKGSKNFTPSNVIMLIQALIAAQELLRLQSDHRRPPDVTFQERNKIKIR